MLVPYIRQRILASLVHLAISILLISGVLAVVLLVWYPNPYFEAMGVGEMLLILAFVDVAIGPLITLIIFNPAKKSLKFDLSVIAIVQIIALMYGVHTVFAGRPVFVVFNVDRFTMVSAADIPIGELAKAHDQSLSLTGPRIVGARLPANQQESERILFSSIKGGPDLPQMPQYYLSYEAVASDVKTKMRPLDVLVEGQPKAIRNQAQSLINDVVLKRELRADDVGFVPMRGKVRDFAVLVRRTDASIISILPINPWVEK